MAALSLRVAVLGGGPGAGAAALRLARGGAEAVVFAPELRGEKPCGGALPEHVLPRLEGFDAAALPAVRDPEALLEAAPGWRVRVPLPGIRIFRRGDLDPALLRAAVAAGAARVSAKAEGLTREGDRWVVHAAGREHSFDWVICASGARGLGRRALGEEAAATDESVGLGGSLRGLDRRTMVLAFPDCADAYLWIFPRPGGASVGIAYTAGELSDGAAGGLLAGFLDRHLPSGWRDLPGPRYRYPIPVWGDRTLPRVRAGLDRRLLLVGDSAGMADPLTREGIRYALLSGLWAAEALLRGQPEGYPATLERELEPELGRALRARRIFFAGELGQWTIPVARLHPGVRRVLRDLLACRQPYRGLRRRLLRAAVGRRARD